MARIRSIKPDFFTSETIASLPLSTRLTFIGLWTYVDDNGVGLDNDMLINAAIWPLEEDSLETLARTREDIATLARIGLVKRYRDSRKRYLHIASWDEHQKVDHPGKKRYPRPDDEGCEPVVTCEDTDPPETLASDSRDTLESLAPEQGAGSREQGAKTLGRQAGRSRPPEPGSDADSDFAAFWDAYPRKVAKGAARRAWRAAIRKTEPKVIVRGAQLYAGDPARRSADITFTAHPATWLNGERWLEQQEPSARRLTGFWEN